MEDLTSKAESSVVEINSETIAQPSLQLGLTNKDVYDKAHYCVEFPIEEDSSNSIKALVVRVP